MWSSKSIGGLGVLALALAAGPFARPAAADEYLYSLGAGSSVLRWDGSVSQTAASGGATIWVDANEWVHITFTGMIDDQSIFYGASHYVIGTVTENGAQLAQVWACRSTGGWETGRWWYTPELKFRLSTSGQHQLNFQIDVYTGGKHKKSTPGTIWVHVQ